MKTKGLLSVFVALAGIVAWQPNPVSAGPSGKVYVQILAVNDFHGHLEPPEGLSSRIGTIEAGGAEYLASHIQHLRALNPNTVVVSAGDMIGSSPLISALFHDEPTIEAFNHIGLDFNAVGNHEFDEGVNELLRMADGGCHPVDGCLDGDGFAGANFQYLAANVVWRDNGMTLFPAYKIREFEGVTIAFIGMTLEGTSSIVSPAGVAGLHFRDEADTVNALVNELKHKGIKTIVVLIHEGGAQVDPSPYNGCVGISGAIIDIVKRFDPEVDVVISGHTHRAYNCIINNMLVTSGASFGRLLTDIDMVVDQASGDVDRLSAYNHIVTHSISRDHFITALIEKYKALAVPLASRIIGSITADISHIQNSAGESALGDVIADSQLSGNAQAGPGDGVIAFINPGGIRSDLGYARNYPNKSKGQVNYGDLFTILPFGDNLVTMTLTGKQIKAVLEQQFDNPIPGQNRILQVSEGFSYTWSKSAPIGSKILNLRLKGVPLDMTLNYRVTVNSFLAEGGDNFSAFKEGTKQLVGAADMEALEAYLKSYSPIAPGRQDRITLIP